MSGVVIQIGCRPAGEVDATLFDNMAAADLLGLKTKGRPSGLGLCRSSCSPLYLGRSGRRACIGIGVEKLLSLGSLSVQALASYASKAGKGSC